MDLPFKHWAQIFGNPISITITENRIEMPVFATRRVTTGLTIYDGYTVAVGGLMREDVQNVEDSVPILGDLPIIGRLFRSKAESRIKSNLIIFVTAEIIDAAGARINAAYQALLRALEVLRLNQSCHSTGVTDYCLHARFYQSFFERSQINPLAVFDG